MSVFEIRVQGRLDQHWATWFEGLTLTYEGDNTVLRGPLEDEAALHSVLTKIGSLNLHLLSVHAVEPGVTAAGSPATPHTPAALGHAPVPPDGSPSAPPADTPVPQRRQRKARRPRTRPPPRPPS